MFDESGDFELRLQSWIYIKEMSRNCAVGLFKSLGSIGNNLGLSRGD